MARINDRLLVQRVDDHIVVMDESSGDEVTFPAEQTDQVIRALTYLVEIDRPSPA